jgi:GTPase SAR1 family protein
MDAYAKQFKIGIIGMPKTGKTSLIDALKYKYNVKVSYDTQNFCVYSIDFHTTIGKIKLDIWDTKNPDDIEIDWFYINIEHIYIGADAFIYNYDISNIGTLNDLSKPIKVLKMKIEGRKFFAVGCKSDLQDKPLNFNNIDKILSRHITYNGRFETSNKHPETIYNMFEKIIKNISNSPDIEIIE